MPFKSKSQLRTCFGKDFQDRIKGKKSNWNCKKFLKETRVKAENLPERCPKSCKVKQGRPVKHTVSKIHIGPRGGMFFFVDKLKVYVPKSVKSSMKQKKK